MHPAWSNQKFCVNHNLVPDFDVLFCSFFSFWASLRKISACFTENYCIFSCVLSKQNHNCKNCVESWSYKWEVTVKNTQGWGWNTKNYKTFCISFTLNPQQLAESTCLCRQSVKQAAGGHRQDFQTNLFIRRPCDSCILLLCLFCYPSLFRVCTEWKQTCVQNWMLWNKFLAVLSRHSHTVGQASALRHEYQMFFIFVITWEGWISSSFISLPLSLFFESVLFINIFECLMRQWFAKNWVFLTRRDILQPYCSKKTVYLRQNVTDFPSPSFLSEPNQTISSSVATYRKVCSPVVRIKCLQYRLLFTETFNANIYSADQITFHHLHPLHSSHSSIPLSSSHPSIPLSSSPPSHHPLSVLPLAALLSSCPPSALCFSLPAVTQKRITLCPCSSRCGLRFDEPEGGCWRI